MRLSSSDIERFAEWSGDRNPLHVNQDFARQTYFGRPIAHGMLTVIHALRAVELPEGERLNTLEIEFRGAVIPEAEYQLDSRLNGSQATVAIRKDAESLLFLRGGFTSRTGPVEAFHIEHAAVGRAELRDSARDRDIAELRPGLSVEGVYTTPAPGADYLANRVLTPCQARILGLCSYLVGMELPGLRSLFTRLRLEFHETASEGDSLVYRLCVMRFDPQFRVLDTSLEVSTAAGDMLATGEVRSYVPFSPAVTNLDQLAARLSPETKSLAGKVALVCGASRGLGADIAAALALSGCHVYANYRTSSAAADELATRLAKHGRNVTLLPGDASDAKWCSTALETIFAQHGRLDVLVLNACAPPRPLSAGSKSFAEFDAYLNQNLRLVRMPLGSFLGALGESQGKIVAISSSFVDESPKGYDHYVALKQATEGLVRCACENQSGVSGLIARPPRLQTTWNDTPAGILGAIPARQAASVIVSALSVKGSSGAVDVLKEFPVRAPQDFEQPDEPADFRLTICASFTTEPLVPGLRFWFKELGLRGGVEIAPYGQVLQELLNPASLLSSNKRGVGVILLRSQDWLRELPPKMTDDAEALRDHLEATADEFARAVCAHRTHASVDTILVLCPNGDSSDATIASLLVDIESRVLAQVQGSPGLQMVVARDFHIHYAVREEAIHDRLRDEIAHVPYRDEYYHVLSAVVARHLHRRLTPQRKVVVVDCDNTLWRGVVGEVGAAGVEFDASHRELHRVLTRLSECGVLACLCSKNDEADVWSVFESRSDFGLRREQVVASAIDWRPKSENLRLLASRLNLGLDSFVFLDDNPVECAEVRAGCPQVLTLEWPSEADRATQLLRHIWELDVGQETSEDRQRTELYREEFHRQELKDQALTFRDFIDSLNLEIDISPLAPQDLSRASQLTLRTNQFNFTTRRRNESELQTLLAADRFDCRTVKVRDRFGDYGLVGLLIGERQDQTLAVDTFLLSCRVLGRGVEHRMAAELGRLAGEQGLTSVRLTVQHTRKNAPARAFLAGLASCGESIDNSEYSQCILSPHRLGEVKFDPNSLASEAAPEDAAPMSPTDGADERRTRLREQQVYRTAYELSTQENLLDEIKGKSNIRPSAQALPQINPGDVAAHVCRAFADALHAPVEVVQEADRLDALGCDSFKIVEITVALTQQFPWLPSTLLFEHRSISEIVEHIVRLTDKRMVERLEKVVSAPDSASEQPSAGHDIAVVGLSVRCAGAESADELWDLLSAGRSAVAPVPASRKCFFGMLQDEREHWAGLIDDIDAFDAEFFGVSPREAEMMDPQLRLFLHSAWGAIEDAGLTGVNHCPDTGVYVGVMYHDYAHFANAGTQATPYRCWESFSLANRLSQALGFHGPSFAVDTACSSSGTALHLACKALAAGECSAAVVGGINLILDPKRFTQLGGLGILSPTGKCRAFGAEADGTVLGEGVGVVVLRRLDEALRGGERIYGVIKGSALSVGAGTVGFTAPNPSAQSTAILAAVAQAKIDPRTISYVETHGTGTSLGDPIEVRGLELGYGDERNWDRTLIGRHRCRIGSIKPNIGHLEAGAGVVSLIKVLLQLQRGVLLPSLTSPEPNPQIPFADLPFEIQRSLEPWERPVMEIDGKPCALPRRAGLSSFGVGGANAHLIIEEPPEAIAVPPSQYVRPQHLLLLSAKNEESLKDLASRTATHWQSLPGIELGDLCHTLSVGRKHHERRRALVVGDREQAMRGLAGVAGERKPDRRSSVAGAKTSPKIAFLFTGQGAQYVGMGRELYKTSPVFAQAMDRCAEILDGLLDQPLRNVLFAAPDSPLGTLLDQTAFTQPALFALEYALSELWKSWGIRPDAVMGHSVGELAALCVAGVMSLEDGLKLIAARGRLMGALPRGGAMVSVRASEDAVRSALRDFRDRVSIAAVNSQRQVVVSGDEKAVAEVCRAFEAQGVQTKSLTVSHAFHSPSMEPMLAEYEAIARTVALSDPSCLVVSCVTAEPFSLKSALPGYWVRQVRETVQFSKAVETLDGRGGWAYLELGPQPVLTGLGRQCLAGEERSWLPSLKRGVGEWQSLLESLGELYSLGIAIDWKRFDAPYAAKSISLPTYPFRPKRYWVRGGIFERPPIEPSSETTISPNGIGRKLYQVVWKEIAPTSIAQNACGHWMILADEGGFGDSLAKSLSEQGAACSVVRKGTQFVQRWNGDFEVDPRSRHDFARLLEETSVERGALCGVVQLWALDASDAANAIQETGLEATLHLAQSILQSRDTGARLYCVTRGAIAPEPAPNLGGAENASAALSVAQAPLWGFGRTAALEMTKHWGGMIDLAPGADATSEAQAVAARLLAPAGEDQLALRQGRWRAARLARVSPAARTTKLALRPDGVYLVTGGLGALGLRMAHWLVAHGARKLVLVSRRGLALSGAEDALRALQCSGVEVQSLPADVSCARDVALVLTRIAEGGGTLRGVVHAAGLDGLKPIEQMTADDMQSMLAGKAGGAWLLHDATKKLELDLFLCFSSFAAVFGSAGRAHYGAANAFLDSLVQLRRRMGLPASCINWGPWKGGGMATDESLQLLERMGNRGLAPDEALAALDRVLEFDLEQAIVADVDWGRFRPVYEARSKRPLLADFDAIDANASCNTDALPPWRNRELPINGEPRSAAIEALVRAAAVQTLGLDDPQDVPLDRDLFSIGMDSLLAVEFGNRLRETVGEGDTALVLEHPTICGLSEVLAARLAAVQPSDIQFGAKAQNERCPSDWAEQLQKVASTERTVLLARLLQREAATILGLDDPESLPIDRGLAEMGMDSLTGAEFVRRIETRLGARTSPQVFEFPHLTSLAEYLNSNVPVGDASSDGVIAFDPRLQDEVFDFSKSAWPRRRVDWIAPRWQWMFVESAKRFERQPAAWLYRSAQKIVGIQGAFPVKVKIGAQERPSAWFVDTMVLESHRDRGIGPRLLMEAKKSFPFSLSLGQTSQMRRIQCQLGWRQVAPLQTWTLTLNPARVLAKKLPQPAIASAAGLMLKSRQAARKLVGGRAAAGVEMRRLDDFEERHDQLWRSVRENYVCTVVRDASYLNWKYVNQPGQSFERLELRRDDEPVALAVVMFREPDDVYPYERAFLVDLVAPPHDRSLLFALFDAVCDVCRERKVDALSLHMICDKLIPAVRAYGFLKRPATRYLLVCPENESQEVQDAVLRRENWLITMGDSDIDRPW